VLNIEYSNFVMMTKRSTTSTDDDVTSQTFQTDNRPLRFMLLQLNHGFHPREPWVSPKACVDVCVKELIIYSLNQDANTNNKPNCVTRIDECKLISCANKPSVMSAPKGVHSNSKATCFLAFPPRILFAQQASCCVGTINSLHATTEIRRPRNFQSFSVGARYRMFSFRVSQVQAIDVQFL
jgi:hypothetical protein